MSDEGALPEGWCLAKLHDICHVDVGFAFKSKEFTDDGIRLLRGDNIEPGALRWRNAKHWPESELNGFEHLLVKPGEIILAMDRPLISSGLKIARASASDLPCLLVQRMARLRMWDERITPFAYIALQTHDFVSHLVKGQTGTQLPHISGKGIGSYEMPVPPINEQARIVAKVDELLSDLDAGVAALERAQANLKRYRAAVLKAAVEGKLTQQWRAEHPDVEPASQLLKRILTERRQRWEQEQLAKYEAKGKQPPKNWKDKYKEPAEPDVEGLPELPEGWCWATVESISTKVVDGVHKKPTYVKAGVPFIKVRNLTSGPGVDFDDVDYVTMDDHKKFCERTNPECGDLLISKDGTLGVVRAVRTNREFSLFVSVALVKPIDTALTDYLETALSSPIVQEQMVGKGSGMQHIHLEDLRKDCVPIPPLAEQAQIVQDVAARTSVLDALENELQTDFLRASRLRQSILKHAFEGKLVPQDANDEPARELLTRINASLAEKSRSDNNSSRNTQFRLKR